MASDPSPDGISTQSSLDEQDPRIEALFQHIMDLSAGDLSTRGEPSERGDVVDAITMGFNMLAEEMQARITLLKQTESKLAEQAEALKRSNQKLQEFVYVASHDLQEPLRMISAYTELLAEEYRDRLDEDAHEYIHYASDGAQRLQRLIRALLTYSRTSAQKLHARPVSLTKVVEEARLNLHIALEESGGQIDVDPLPRVHGDPTLLVQLLQNLLSNAIKFRGEQSPRICISTTTQDSHVTISVQDNGIGINSEFLDKIFVVFQRLHRSNAYEGTGIGLSICRDIVERHGGRIWVESEPGHGSTFRFTLSAATESEGGASE